MKSNFYWIKVGLLIGLGFMLAKFLLPFGILALFFLVPFFVIVPILGFAARSLGAVVGYLKMRHGWMKREQASVHRC